MVNFSEGNGLLEDQAADKPEPDPVGGVCVGGNWALNLGRAGPHCSDNFRMELPDAYPQSSGLRAPCMRACLFANQQVSTQALLVVLRESANVYARAGFLEK